MLMWAANKTERKFWADEIKKLLIERFKQVNNPLMSNEEATRKMEIARKRITMKNTWCYILYQHLKQKFVADTIDALDSSRPEGGLVSEVQQLQSVKNWLTDLYQEFYTECQKKGATINCENSFAANEREAQGIVFIPVRVYKEALEVSLSDSNNQVQKALEKD